MCVSVDITDCSWALRTPRSQPGSVVRAADDADIDTVWVADHLIRADPASTPDAEMLEVDGQRADATKPPASSPDGLPQRARRWGSAHRGNGRRP